MSEAVVVAPPSEAVIVTGVEALTMLVFTVKVAVLAPVATVTLAGTVAAGELLERFTETL